METLLANLIKILNSPIFQEELKLLCGIETEIQKLSSLLLTTKAVLEDAEQKQFTDTPTLLWLQKINLIAYEVDDILDDYATEVSRELKCKNICCNVLDCLPATSNICFRHKIGARIKKIIGKFDAVAAEREKLHLNGPERGKGHSPVETGSLLNEPDLVLGRDEENDGIVDILVNQVRDNQNVSVLPIVGVGGLGKTTLAQLVFNDQRIIEHFELKLWVWVSKDFDVRRIIKTLIGSEQGTSPEAPDLDSLQRKLQELLRAKRYLVILDDVWNDKQEEWENLKSVLACGSRGSSIIVTTRMEMVATIMGTLQTHHLLSLSDNLCWSLFSQRAFGHQEMQEYPKLVAIGREIVNKCGGVPLAAKALGGFLRFKREETEWNFVNDSEIWNLPQDRTDIMPVLRLSYLNLPVELRDCFAYCAVFSKEYEIEKEEVIHLWMANGLISSKGNMEVEDVGDAVLTELHYRSLFEAVKKDEFGRVLTFKMHDLVHDLAQSVMEGKHGGAESDSTIRYLALDLRGDDLTVAFPIRRTRGTHRFSSFLPKYGSLRAFIPRSIWCDEFRKFSAAINNLKHLRYLNLSGSYSEELPNSICDLWNLQILNLNSCTQLRLLPKGMRFLRNLRHLCLKECQRLTHMPSGIGQLTCLRTLSKVALSGNIGFQLSELRNINNLGGELTIAQLEKVEHRRDAEEANLIAKQSLRKLRLEWDTERRSQPPHNDEAVLEALKPCPSLQMLYIQGFGGATFPAWISTLTNVVEMELLGCSNSTRRLPVLGNLPRLQRLFVTGSGAEYIDDDNEQQIGEGAQESVTAAAAVRFPSLEVLHLCSMTNLKGMLGRGMVRSQGTNQEVFPRLQFLQFFTCPTLAWPLPHMLSLRKLHVWLCSPNMAWASISNLTSLNSLTIVGIEGLSCFPEEMLQNLSLLESLEITGMRDLQGLPGRSLASLTALKELAIRECRMLTSLPEEGLQGLASLQKLYLLRCYNLESLSMGTQALKSLTLLHITGSYAATLPKEVKHFPALQQLDLSEFPNLTSLPEWFGDHLTSLQHLTLRDCPKLETLPSSIQMMTTLQSLAITNCELLGPRCEREGPEWHKIQHIPQVII